MNVMRQTVNPISVNNFAASLIARRRVGPQTLWAPGRFAQKPVPPGTIRLGRFAQNFERDCSHKLTGTVRSKFNLLGQFSLFNFQKEKKKKLLRLSFHLFLIKMLSIINVEKN